MDNTPPQSSNRLAFEKSPYLLQHADNPVDWFPWGDEAFAKARAEDKPVFLSIGYSTCHWCHVMAHESFEDTDIARMINDYFVPVKVDREERPDIDHIYMTAVQSITGSGGWPLTVFLTPDKKPFYGGTYFPPYAKWGHPGLTDIMQSVHSAWQGNREAVLQSGENMAAALARRTELNNAPGELTQSILEQSFREYAQMYDAQYGGFGQAPKFPTGHNLSYLLRYYRRTHDAKALAMVEHTLQSMANGGMYDQVGGGFHRYSTDQYWQVPHFEKMLYDQAILARTYLEAYQVTQKDFYAGIAREIFEYVLRDLTDKDGGFYSAEDADSLDPDDPDEFGEKKEGSFYLWRQKELEKVLGRDAEVVGFYYSACPGGNARNDPHNEFTGKNILYVAGPMEKTAERFQMPVEAVTEIIGQAKVKLLAYRSARPRPHLDDKIIVDWNGLMIGAFAFGSRVLKEPRYRLAAEKAADFILKAMTLEDHRIARRYRGGSADIAGMLEDYAFFSFGLMELYEADFDIRYLRHGLKFSEKMLELFEDPSSGGFYFTPNDAPVLIVRQKEIYDGAVPSGNSIAALNCVRLYHFTLDDKWRESADKIFKAFALTVQQHPSAYAQFMAAFDFALGPSAEIVIAAGNNASEIDAFVETVYDSFRPGKVVLMRPNGGADLEDLSSISPFITAQVPVEGTTTVYVCEHHVCRLPVTTREAFKLQMKEL